MLSSTSSLLLAAAAGASMVSGAAISARQSSTNTAYVDLSQNARRSTSERVASGVLYGIPDDYTQIPNSFYSDMGFNFGRYGGAQMEQGGWIDGIQAYYARFNDTRGDYIQARKFNNAGVFVLPHDIWGTDHTNSSSVWPGDNGNWTNYDQFVQQLMSDIKANNMLDGLIWDTWNEPDGGFFWQRSQAQYLELWSRTYQMIRSDPAFDAVLISGPSSAGQPSPNNAWWTEWVQYVLSSNTVPDMYTWHDEPGDLVIDMPNFQYIQQEYNLPIRTININEYGTFDQQAPAGAAWWISRLERYDVHGLRGNWLSSCQLRDFLASLLTKTDFDSCTSAAGYAGNGEYLVYRYYNQNMTGARATTVGTEDLVMDVYATVDSDKVRVLTGVNGQQGTWYITISDLSAVGLPENGTLNIQTYGFIDDGHTTAVSGPPTNRGVYGHAYSGNSVTFPVYQTSQEPNTAWVFEFDIPQTTTQPSPNDPCGPQAPGYGPATTSPDTAAAFEQNPIYSATAKAAAVPADYQLAFQALNASSQQSGYLTHLALQQYSPADCAAQCAATKGCVAFNLYFERNPTLNPASVCANPASETTIQCALYSSKVTAAGATNRGQWRENFQVVIAGSNGYNIK